MKRRKQTNEKGFALLFIVMVVAVVAVAAAALLDIVEVDLVIAGEHRRSSIAEAIAEGAILEVQADNTKAALLPNSGGPSLTVLYAGLDGSGDFVRDPFGLDGGPTVMDETNSAYVRNNSFLTASAREGYTAEMRLLRSGPAIGSGINTARVVVYEIRAMSSVNDGAASSEVAAETYSYAYVREGVVGQRHAR